MKNVHEITALFEYKLCEYTGSKYAVCVDSNSNALFLSLYYENKIINSCDKTIIIPSRTYPSVPCEIIHAGLKVCFDVIDTDYIQGAYQLKGSKVWDSALRFTHDMYIHDTHMCLSFTGPHKHLKLSKGGAILTDDFRAYCWFKRARYSGRRECSYHEDNFDMLGWNFYMMPEVASRGLLLMSQFYDPISDEPMHVADKKIRYPDLSKFKIYKK